MQCAKEGLLKRAKVGRGLVTNEGQHKVAVMHQASDPKLHLP